MRFVRNYGLDRDISVLGFGAAAVLGRSGKRDSLNALSAAIDVGINFFDTARSYGYGESEALLGQFLAGRRHSVTIATKFGIVPTRQSNWKQFAKPIARVLTKAIPGTRRTFHKYVTAQFQPGQFTIPILVKSVEESLKNLRTDYLDILLMHEATRAAIEDDELLEAMQKLRVTGKVRLIGASSEPDIAAEAANSEAIGVIQYPSHIGNGFKRTIVKNTRKGAVLKVVNHPFGGASGIEALKISLASIASKGALPPNLREKLRDQDSALLADVALNLALGSDNDVVLATMMQPYHIGINAAAITNSRFDERERLQLHGVLLEFVTAPGGASAD